MVIARYRASARGNTAVRDALVRATADVEPELCIDRMLDLCEERLAGVVATNNGRFNHAEVQRQIDNVPSKEALAELYAFLNIVANTDPHEYRASLNALVPQAIFDEMIAEYQQLSESSFGRPYLMILDQQINIVTPDHYCVLVFRLMEHFVLRENMHYRLVHMVEPAVRGPLVLNDKIII